MIVVEIGKLNKRIQMESEIIKKKEYKDLKETFEIPIYQRQYAWKPEHVETLLNDLDSWKEDKYFLGNIVVKEADGKLEVIDGQQRLTTLYLISFFAKDIAPFNLTYKIREEANKFLQAVKQDRNILKDKKNIPEEFLENINTIEKWIKENKISAEELQELLEKVVITITKLPEGTDVEKFFEVMNNRGKQLEQHQVLKAKFLEALKNEENQSEKDNINYSKIWDFCSNMNYLLEDLVYYSLPENQRSGKEIREKLNNFILNNRIPEYFKKNDSKNGLLGERKKISDIIKSKEDKNTENKEFYLPETKEISTPVNFSIFLLHTLKLFLREKENKFNNGWENVQLDDKKLLEQFLENNKFIFDKELAKEFIKFLLKIRTLFDKFIFKRGKDIKGEEILFITREDENIDSQNLINLQLLFSFTSPNYQYQEWLTPALYWFLKNYDKDSKEIYKGFIEFLKNLDKHLALKRLEENPDLKEVFNKFIENLDYKELIQDENELEEKLNKKLNNGTATEHYWFYKLEYILWEKSGEIFENFKDGEPFKESDKFKYSKIKNNYRLTRKSSIEHIQPQSKANENGWEKGNSCDNKCQIDCFGNLALISSHLNSKLINQNFELKRIEIQKQLANGTIESLKMLLVYSKYKEWNPENCKEHHNEMIEFIKSSFRN